jgi:ribosome biogenesis protein SSF1/2
MAGPLGVTHLLFFTRSTNGNTTLRLALSPRGPTLHFKVEKYSLCKDIQRAIRHPKGLTSHFLTSPLLVMNNFVTDQEESAGSKKTPRHLETLVTTIFQSLFPSISPQTTSLSTIRRVLLLNRDTKSEPDAEGSFILNLRHYAITTKLTHLSKAVRRLNASEKLAKRQNRSHAIPDLGRFNDVADLILDPSAAAMGYTSESEIETDAEIEVLPTITKKVQSSAQHRKKQSDPEPKLQPQDDVEQNGNNSPNKEALPENVEKRAVKLVEIGPRLNLRLIKVEEGLCDGKIMWHDFIQKSKAEQKQQDGEWKRKQKLKAERTRIQTENVQRKKAEKEAEKEASASKALEKDEDMAEAGSEEEWLDDEEMDDGE